MALVFGLPGVPVRPGTPVPTGPAYSRARARSGEGPARAMFFHDAARDDIPAGQDGFAFGMELTQVDGTTFAQRRERVEQLMAEAGIEVRPSLSEAKRDDWLVMSMPVRVPVPEASPDPVPTAEWFAHMASVRTDTEREVEMHYASPLFREGLGYREDQEAAGFGIRWAGEAPRGTSRPTCCTSPATSTT